jgi:hypothetical protein
MIQGASPLSKKKDGKVTPRRRWPQAANTARTTAIRNLARITSLADYGDSCVEVGNRAATQKVLAQIARLAVEARAELLMARADEMEGEG